jgi:predicted TIM-barrel fold metal-dependent hydrolase
MIIDCHTHLGRNEHINARVDQLLKSMDEANIDKAMVFAGELNGLSTHSMLEEIKPHRDRLYGVASWDFECHLPRAMPNGDLIDQSEYLARLYQSGEIVAVKFYTGYYHKMPSDLGWALDSLNKVGCPAIFHCGDCLNSVKCAKLKYAHPLNIDEVAVDFPNMNFIIAHMGYPWHRDAAEVCYKNDNVYSDISGFVYGGFAEGDMIKFKKVLNEFLDIAGSDKLLFGTDYPISWQDAYVDVLDTSAGEYLTAQYLTKNVIKAFKLQSKEDNEILHIQGRGT